jgi:hypothetical protein
VIEIVSDPTRAQEVEVRAEGVGVDGGPLPVLPLRDVVPVPDTMLPLAIGQERSVSASTPPSRATVPRSSRRRAPPRSRPRGPRACTTWAWSARSCAC